MQQVTHVCFLEASGYLHTAGPLMLSVASGTSRWLVSFPDYIHSVVFDTLFQPLGAFFPLSDLLGLRLALRRRYYLQCDLE